MEEKHISSSILQDSDSAPPNHFQHAQQQEQPSWKKLLYLQQPFPDNYTDQSFLSQLKRNTTVAKYSYKNLVQACSFIVFYISCILLVILMFIGIYEKQWDPIIPTLISTGISLVGFFSLKNLSMNMRSLMVITFILLIVSPILKSLTKSTSSDSIWAISCVLCLANSIFHDYSMKVSYRPIVSTNISLSNAIVLASRLSTTLDVFLFVLFAIEVNILLPLFDAKIRLLGLETIHWPIAFLTFNLTSYLMYILLNYKFLVYWILSVFVMVVIMPIYFLSLQRYKNEIQGPWDVAKPKLMKSSIQS